MPKSNAAQARMSSSPMNRNEKSIKNPTRRDRLKVERNKIPFHRLKNMDNAFFLRNQYTSAHTTYTRGGWRIFPLTIFGEKINATALMNSVLCQSQLSTNGCVNYERIVVNTKLMEFVMSDSRNVIDASKLSQRARIRNEARFQEHSPPQRLNTSSNE